MTSILIEARDQTSLNYTNNSWHKCAFITQRDIHFENVRLNYIHLPNQLFNIQEGESFVVHIGGSSYTVNCEKAVFGQDDAEEFCVWFTAELKSISNPATDHFEMSLGNNNVCEMRNDSEITIDFSNTNVNFMSGFEENVVVNSTPIQGDHPFDPWRNLRQVYIFANFYQNSSTLTNNTSGLIAPWIVLPMTFSGNDPSSTFYTGDSIDTLYVQKMLPQSLSIAEFSFMYRKGTNYYPYPFSSHEITLSLLFF